MGRCVCNLLRWVVLKQSFGHHTESQFGQQIKLLLCKIKGCKLEGPPCSCHIHRGYQISDLMSLWTSLDIGVLYRCTMYSICRTNLNVPVVWRCIYIFITPLYSTVDMVITVECILHRLRHFSSINSLQLVLWFTVIILPTVQSNWPRIR